MAGQPDFFIQHPAPRAADHLVTALQAAVPLIIADLKTLTDDERAWKFDQWRPGIVDTIASRSDVMLFGGGKRGEAADVFNRLARGVAMLAHQPGGVTLFGLIWCAEHSPRGTTPVTPPLCTPCLEREGTAA